MANTDNYIPLKSKADKAALQNELNNLQNSLNKKPLKYHLKLSTSSFQKQLRKMSSSISKNLEKALDVDSSSLKHGVKQLKNLAEASANIKNEMGQLNSLQSSWGASRFASNQVKSFKNLTSEFKKTNSTLSDLTDLTKSLKNISISPTLDLSQIADAASAIRDQEKSLESLGEMIQKSSSDLNQLFGALFNEDFMKRLSDSKNKLDSTFGDTLKKDLTELPPLLSSILDKLDFSNVGRVQKFALTVKYADHHMCSAGYRSFHMIPDEIHQGKRRFDMVLTDRRDIASGNHVHRYYSSAMAT